MQNRNSSKSVLKTADFVLLLFFLKFVGLLCIVSCIVKNAHLPVFELVVRAISVGIMQVSGGCHSYSFTHASVLSVAGSLCQDTITFLSDVQNSEQVLHLVLSSLETKHSSNSGV